MIYLDNAATSYPKPPEVIRAITEATSIYGANPGRSGHDMSVAAAMKVYEAREVLNDFFNGYGSEYVSFFPNCTYALNAAIKGLVKKGDHIIVSSLEHNSVLRPVHKLRERGIADYSVFEASSRADEVLESIRKKLRFNTRLCVITAVSNVFGTILPLKEISRFLHKRGIRLIVDGAQGAGVIDINMKEIDIDCLCVPGHKGLWGPMGTGALLHKGALLETLTEGGTGTRSLDLVQPAEYPERLESGTLNVSGICGLSCGTRLVKEYGIDKIFEEETELCRELFYGLKELSGIELYEEKYDNKARAPLLSFNVKGLNSEKTAMLLNREGFAVRGGYHCSPLAHLYNGTKRNGTVRVSPSHFNTKKDIKNLLNFLPKICII